MAQPVKPDYLPSSFLALVDNKDHRLMSSMSAQAFLHSGALMTPNISLLNVVACTTSTPSYFKRLVTRLLAKYTRKLMWCTGHWTTHLTV